MSFAAPKGEDTPFAQHYKEYREKGWDVVPLPFQRKNPPPDGFTGRINKGVFAEELQFKQWVRDGGWTTKRNKFMRLGNIAVHPGREIELHGRLWEFIGIDIDDYAEKTGWAEIKKLEETLGPLPDTWTSSARADFRSGIRWYLVPYGFEYKGKVCESVEVIQHVHRYGVVWPSYNPDAKARYQWYEPGERPNGRAYYDGVPDVKTLAILPDPWIKHVLKGVRQTGTESIDEESTSRELTEWAKNTMGSNKAQMCLYVKNTFNSKLKEFLEGDDHHDPLVNFHWLMSLMGVEGHSGARTAVKLFEHAWMKRLEDEGDLGERNLFTAQLELLRSREGALRKIKARIEDGEKEQLLPGDCDCGKPSKPNGQQPNTTNPQFPYERNEDGNAQHFLDLFGTNLRYVPNHPTGEGKWLVFQPDRLRWVVDENHTLVRNMYREVKKAQIATARTVLDANPASADAKAWLKWSMESGNSARVTNSLKQATTFPGVSVDFEELDNHPYLVPVANGLIKFHTKAERLAGASEFDILTDPSEVKGYMITQNTHVPYIKFAEQKTHEDPTVRKNFDKFVRQMHTFLKNDMSDEVWSYTLRLLGFSILGINPKKAIFLVGAKDTGKSTFQNMMNAALGDLSIWREPRILLDSRFKGALAEALSRRVCMVGELGEKTIDAGLFKRITGNDEVSCELKGLNKPVTLRARCVLISGCNDAPEVPSVDSATKSRFVVIPFKHRVLAKDKDEGAQDDLMEHCRVPMLAMLIEECAKAIMTGIQGVPDELRMATKVFVSGLNELSDFLDANLNVLPNSEWEKYSLKDSDDPRDPKPRWPDEKCCSTKELYQAYRDYATRTGMDVMSSHKLTRRLKGMGFTQDGSKGKDDQLRWIGVTLSNKMHKVQEA